MYIEQGGSIVLHTAWQQLAVMVDFLYLGFENGMLLWGRYVLGLRETAHGEVNSLVGIVHEYANK